MIMPAVAYAPVLSCDRVRSRFCHGLEHLALRVVGDRAAGRVLLAPLREVVEGVLEAGRLGFGAGDVALLRVDRAVEHHGPDVLREQLGVGRAEQGAVGEAEVVGLRVADALAQRVDVARGLLGGEQRELVRRTWRRTRSPIFLLSATTWSNSACVCGSGSAANRASSSLAVRHLTGDEWPTPRGSKPTRSNRLGDRGGHRPGDVAEQFEAGTAGPPGFIRSEPIRGLDCLSARARATAMSNVLPLPGCFQSCGTATLPQSKVKPATSRPVYNFGRFGHGCPLDRLPTRCDRDRLALWTTWWLGSRRRREGR